MQHNERVRINSPVEHNTAPYRSDILEVKMQDAFDALALDQKKSVIKLGKLMKSAFVFCFLD